MTTEYCELNMWKYIYLLLNFKNISKIVDKIRKIVYYNL